MPSYHCRYASCSAYLPHRGYCPQHQQQAQAQRRDTDRMYDDKQRDPKAKAFYRSAEWTSTRANKIQRDPFCEICIRQPATEVHHIEPLRSNWDKRLDQSNLMSVCKPCHIRHERGGKRRLD